MNKVLLGLGALVLGGALFLGSKSKKTIFTRANGETLEFEGTEVPVDQLTTYLTPESVAELKAEAKELSNGEHTNEPVWGFYIFRDAKGVVHYIRQWDVA